MKIISKVKYNIRTEKYSCICGYQLSKREIKELVKTGIIWKILTEKQYIDEVVKNTSYKISEEQLEDLKNNKLTFKVQEEIEL